MSKIEVVDVVSENNEAVEEVKPVENNEVIEEVKPVENNDVVDEVKPAENNEVVEKEFTVKKQMKEKMNCPTCGTLMTAYNYKYKHACRGVKKGTNKVIDLNKPIRKKVINPVQAEDFKEDVYNRVKSDIPKVDEQEIERRVEERFKKHLETTANKVFETAKDRYINMKVERDNKNKQKINNLARKNS